MCGIGAILDPAGTSGQHAAERMVEALRHRGPDGEALRRIGPVALAHTRLAIIDVAGGDQPLDSEDGRVTAIVNGEIYNHLDLRAELEQRGHRWATNSDSEVVVHAYEEHGVDFVRRLNGIFAFVIWDDREQRLVAARDAFGVKPLYWWTDGRRVALASEIGALIDAGPGRPRPWTASRWTTTSRAGSCRRRGRCSRGCGSCRPRRRSSSREAARRASRAGARIRVTRSRAPTRSWPTRLAGAFEDAVERQMMSDVPYGAFLSGGVDSAGVVAAMKDRSGTPPTTFTIGFPGHGDVLDERALAAETARIIGTDHHDTVMRETDFLTELARCMPRLEEPCGIPSAPALLQLSRFAAQDVKVVLAGQGADEPHGGYGRHRAAALLRPLKLVPPVVAGPAGALARAVPRAASARRLSHVLGGRGDAERLLRLVEITDARVRTELVGPGAEAEQERLATAREIIGPSRTAASSSRRSTWTRTCSCPTASCSATTRCRWPPGLELRVPFLDVELMRFVERIPATRAGAAAPAEAAPQAWRWSGCCPRRS